MISLEQVAIGKSKAEAAVFGGGKHLWNLQLKKQQENGSLQSREPPLINNRLIRNIN